MNMMTAVAAVPAVALSGSANAAPASARSDWDRAFADWKRCHREVETADRRIKHAEAVYEAARPKVEQIDQTVWDEVLQPFASRDPEELHLFTRVVDLDDAWRKFEAGDGRWRFAPDQSARKHRVRAALDELQHFREADALAERDSGYHAAAAARDVAYEAESAARKRLMQTPAPSEQEALWKLEQLFGDKVLAEEGDDYCPAWDLDFCRQFFADVRRLLSQRA
jgi:hypothetical protein